jgi:CO/xanthine dehydrogenase Mo-binding subunit
VVWTRADDLQHDFYRQPTYHWLRAGWADPDPSAVQVWRHFVAAPGLNGVAYRLSDVLKEGLPVPYAITDKSVQATLADIPLPTGPWRAVMSGPNAFANECFLDEVAAARGKDPYQLRRELLPEGDRLRVVLETAASAAHWESPLAEGHGRGIACHTYGDSPVAMVAEVSVTSGQVRVERVVCAIDCGTVVNPDMVVQQMEGGIAFGLTSLLKGEITYERGRVQQSSFDDFPLLQLADMPDVDVHIVSTTRAPQGAGEMGVPPIVPAVVNAIHACTGVRIRRLPLRPGDLAAS